MNCRGFSLFETLVYIALLAILCLVAFSWLSKSAHSVVKINKTSKQVMMAQTIFARLAADVQMADSAKVRWDENNEQLNLHHANRPITWIKQKDKLYRIENKSKSLIGTGITHFSASPIAHDMHITSIVCSLALADVSFTHTIRVYNG